MERRWQDFFDVASWARDSLPPEAVVISRKDRLFYLLSGRAGKVYPMTNEPAAFLDSARHYGARFIVYDPSEALASYYVSPVLQARPNAFCMIHTSPMSEQALLGIRLDAPPGPPGDTVNKTMRIDICPPDFLKQPEPPRPRAPGS
jgi:hypothetical protein